MRYKQNNEFLLDENVRKRFIFPSIARSNVIAMAFESFFKTIVLKKTVHGAQIKEHEISLEDQFILNKRKDSQHRRCSMAFLP